MYIKKTMTISFDYFRGRSMVALLDIISNLCINHGAALEKNPNTSQMLDKVINKWQGLDVGDNLSGSFIESFLHMISPLKTTLLNN